MFNLIVRRTHRNRVRATLNRPGLGIVAGLVMAIGFVVIPGIAMGLDDMDAAPAWVWLGFLGWLGIFFLYPVWSIRFGIGILKEGTGQAIEDL
jgi:multisubunit Na+/H+ antiporter MnhB subunit